MKLFRTYKKWIIGVAAVVLLSGFLVGVLWATNALGWRAWRLQEVQGFIGANLPEGATNARFFTQNTQTRIIWLRFELPPGSDLNGFVQGMGMGEALKTGYTPFAAPNPQEASLNWWTPSAATTFSGVYANDGEKIREILADASDPARLVVYVRAYSIAKR